MRGKELHLRTEILNQKQKNQSRNARYIALRWLMASFPQAFDNREMIRPLKIGIMEDVLKHADKAQAAGISKSKLREAVVLFTRRIDYLTTLKAQEMRIDLEGNPDKPVTEEEAEKAAVKIKRRVEKNIKNARKNTSSKHNETSPKRTPSQPNYQSYYDQEERAYANEAPALNSASKAPPIIVKQKSRQYDPDAVARLKEKLGLSRKKESI